MKKLLTLLAIISAVLTIVLAVLPISNLAIIPAVAALIFGGIAYYLSKKSGNIKKILPFTFLLIACALALITFKALFTTSQVKNTDELHTKEAQFEKDAKKELEDLELEKVETIKTKPTESPKPSIQDTSRKKIEPKTKETKINESEFEDLDFDESDLDFD